MQIPFDEELLDGDEVLLLHALALIKNCQPQGDSDDFVSEVVVAFELLKSSRGLRSKARGTSLVLG